jgi:hypothetical protein
VFTTKQKLPELQLQTCQNILHRKWNKCIWLNYPCDDNFRKHNVAKESGIMPRNAKIGGEIGIHGVRKGMDIIIDYRQN